MQKRSEKFVSLWIYQVSKVYMYNFLQKVKACKIFFEQPYKIFYVSQQTVFVSKESLISQSYLANLFSNVSWCVGASKHLVQFLCSIIILHASI